MKEADRPSWSLWYNTTIDIVRSEKADIRRKLNMHFRLMISYSLLILYIVNMGYVYSILLIKYWYKYFMLHPVWGPGMA